MRITNAVIMTTPAEVFYTDESTEEDKDGTLCEDIRISGDGAISVKTKNGENIRFQGFQSITRWKEDF